MANPYHDKRGEFTDASGNVSHGSDSVPTKPTYRVVRAGGHTGSPFEDLPRSRVVPAGRSGGGGAVGGNSFGSHSDFAKFRRGNF